MTWIVRRYLKQERLVPTGLHERARGRRRVRARRRSSQPNVGKKWVSTWTPLILTFFFFILGANAIGLIPIFDVLGLLDHYVLHTRRRVVRQAADARRHDGDRELQRHRRRWRRSRSARSSSPGRRRTAFVKHWKNLVPHGLAWPIYILLIPIEIMGMFVRPFALTMRLAANMTGGHIAILAILSFVFLFTRAVRHGGRRHRRRPGVSVPLAVGISALEIIVVLVQAYVFTLLTAVFIGMAIHVHH